MGLTFAWNVNPVEGSVIPWFLTDNLPGLVLLWILLITCMPVWIATSMVGEAVMGGTNVVLPGFVVPLATILSQGIVCFLIGVVIQGVVRKFSGRRRAS